VVGDVIELPGPAAGPGKSESPHLLADRDHALCDLGDLVMDLLG